MFNEIVKLSEIHDTPGNLRVTVSTEVKAWKFGNVELNWPKLFQAFFVKVTLIFYHQCVHSIIPHQHM